MRRVVYDHDHEQFRDSVRQFVAREIEPVVDRLAADRGIPRAIWIAAGRQGLLGLAVPEQYGGADARDYRFTAVLLEELARVNMALAAAFSIHVDVVAPYLMELTTDDQKARWLPGFTSGDLLTAIGMTEPGAGSDLASLRTSAVPHDGGWRINGTKTFITNGGSADLVVVAARTTPETRASGISLFAVETDRDGFSRGRKLDKVGQPESDTSELFFDDAWIPTDNLLGALDGGFAHMMERLPQERLGAAVSNIAHARQILAETVDYAKQRHVFGRAVGTFQHNKFLLADLVTRADVTQCYVDQCVLAHSQGELTAIDAAKAKWWSAQVQNEILDHCVQLHGGYGYMNEYRVARAWKDARVTKIWAGSNEIMKELIGRDLGL
ncbi:MAG: hypothetical protein V7637_1161 [Mycobacteriales bacterium]|jgi:long-chain-acyl-CoA dehydrogenase